MIFEQYTYKWERRHIEEEWLIEQERGRRDWGNQAGTSHFILNTCIYIENEMN